MALLIRFSITLLCFGIVFSDATSYTNPLIPNLDLPDPGAIFLSDGAYFVATTTVNNSATYRYPIQVSKDLVNWEFYTHIFGPSNTPSWAVQDFWAPEIHIIGGTYVCLFAARNTQGMLSIGAARANSLMGPWKDIGQPLVTSTRVGNIDPHFFHDNTTGTQYLIWKEDGNDPAHYEPETPIWAQQLTSDLLLVGERSLLLENDNRTWEGGLVEGPWIQKIGDFYYLFYSANVYDTPKYAIGVARATSVLGPYEKSPRNPLLSSNAAWSGPGHCSALGVENNPAGPYFLLYHAWVAGQVGGVWPRVLMMDAFAIDADGWPAMTDPSAPTNTPQPVPQ